jgi:hypothetical protein
MSKKDLDLNAACWTTLVLDGRLSVNVIEKEIPARLLHEQRHFNPGEHWHCNAAFVHTSSI